jgi:hypothetical protein
LIAFNPPKEMTVGTPERFTVRIARNSAEEAIRKNLAGSGVPEVERIQVGTFMHARLYGDGFDITAYSKESQAVPDNGFAEWSYQLLPLEAGDLKLTLQISLRVKLPGGGEEMTGLPVLDREISVKVNYWWTARQAIAANWSVFLSGLGTILMGVGGYLGKRWFEGRNAGKKAPPSTT